MAEETLLDTPAPAATADPAAPAATPAPAEPVVPVDGSIAQDGDDKPAAAADGADDWRKAMAGDDADALKELARYNTQGDVAKALIEAKKAIRKGDEGKIKIPGEDASDEDRAKFNEALKIPESADKYERVAPPEGLELSEADNEFITSAIADLHKQGGFAAAPENVKMLEGLYHKAMQERASQMAAAAVTMAQESEKALKTEWGSEHKINMAYANSALTSYVPSGKADDLLNLQLADGTKLGAHADFIRMMASAGRATTEDPQFLATLNGGENMSEENRDAEIKRISELRHTDKAAYDKAFPRYQTLLEQRRRASERAA